MIERTAIFGQIIENLSDTELTYDDRKQVYEVILDVFEDFEMKGVEECLDLDKAFDESYYDRYPELNEDDE